MASANHRERLVFHVQQLERLEAEKKIAAADFREALDKAKGEGYDATTLKVVLKLRKMTFEQRRERKALEAIYMAALGMLEGDALPESAREHLAPPQPDEAHEDAPTVETTAAPAVVPPQPTLPMKTPGEAREEGQSAARAGGRIYDNPYPAGDPCRAAWDEGWCAQSGSNGMETPTAFQRRSRKPDGGGDPGGDA